MTSRDSLTQRPVAKTKFGSAFLLIALFISGCEENTSGPDISDTVYRIEIQTDKTELWLADTLQLQVKFFAQNGSELPSKTVSWSSDKPEILEANNRGILTALDTGEAIITATYDNLSFSVTFDVYTYILIYAGLEGDTGIPSLFKLELDEGSVPQQLEGIEPFALEPAASPDGSKLIYTALVDQYNYDLFLYDVETKISTRLTTDDEQDDMGNWSPDNEYVVFRSHIEQRQGHVFTYRLESGTFTNITPDPLPATFENREPAVSPDNTTIVYTSNVSGRANLWLMNTDGFNKTQLTFVDEFYNTEPVWSPDGTHILFRRNYDSTAGIDMDLVVITPDGNEVKRLPLPGQQRMPAWSPDGRWIAFVSHPELNDRPEIYMMRPDGSDMKRITKEVWDGGQNPTFLRIQ